jgi:multicomponent Na+:H+ antiporter subunit E
MIFLDATFGASDTNTVHFGLHPEHDIAGQPLVRFGLFFFVWLMIAGWDPKDLPVGFIAACCAYWISLLLAPQRDWRLHYAPTAELSTRFLRGSIVAGFDVAMRVLRPDMHLAPGFVTASLIASPGYSRDAFCLYQSLQPGVLPTGTEGDVLVFHALDTAGPIPVNVAQDEALFEKAVA